MSDFDFPKRLRDLAGTLSECPERVYLERSADMIENLETAVCGNVAEVDRLRGQNERLRDFIYGADVISTHNGVLLFEVGPCHPDSAAANIWREVNERKAPLPKGDTNS